MKRWTTAKRAKLSESERMADFLVDVALLDRCRSRRRTMTNKVSMMTIHAAKGLEFPYVYVVGLEENAVPQAKWPVNTREELEEESAGFFTWP